MTDLQLSPSIRLSDVPCWEHADARDVEWLRWVARNLWEPVIERWGPVTFTSWRRWARSGCIELRTGDHDHPGTLDAVPQRASISTVHRWMFGHLRDEDQIPLFGSLIDERDHIHATPAGVGAPGGTEFLVEPTEGVYRPVAELAGRGALALAAVATVYLLTRS